MRAFLAILVLACSLSAHATITYVQGGTPATNTANTVNCSTTGSVSAGDLILFMSHESNSIGAAALAVTTSSGPAITYTSSASAYNSASGGFASAVAWGIAPTSGTVTATGTWAGIGAAGFVDCAIADMHSTVGWINSTLDVQVNNVTNPASTSCTSGTTSSTTNATDLIVGVCFNFDSAQTYGAVTGYTFQSNSSRNTLAFYWASTSSTGTQSITVPVSSDVSTGFLIALKEGVNPPTAPGKLVMF